MPVLQPAYSALWEQQGLASGPARAQVTVDLSLNGNMYSAN